ncbi:F0F1 ATP synthase subunit C [Dongia soli]|jgi:F-type H+-transporting ATPase subunit c|uniref:ATP synthase subunit c n=1 Tax=Dongia soli TaxID=600628 RepID=A0ABU5EC42_9PROT|nr:F0F1 ATP synthase subunit C [Dongia soli]MDY0883948.1 F0F1 ATP synthase subunit C [Dongia soli]TXH37277.1 MAG: F0F1 ATP synthase subunit C [Rhodospirillaceae bacterium]
MDPQAAKYIGAGIAALALGGAGIGLGILFGNFMNGALRNPAASAKLFGNMMLTFALVEATGLIAFVVAMLILFAA